MLSYLPLVPSLHLQAFFTHLGNVLFVRFFLGVQQFFFRVDLALQFFVLCLNLGLLSLHFIVTFLQTLLDTLQRLCHGALTFELKGHFLHLSTEFHKVSVSLDVSFLFLLITIDPNLSCVFLCGDQFGLLVDFVKELFALDVILLLERLLLDFKRVCLALNFSALFLLLLELTLVGQQELFFFLVRFFNGTVLLLKVQ